MSDNVLEVPQGVLWDAAGGAVVPPEQTTVVPPEPTEPTVSFSPEQKYSICDRQFMDDVAQLKALRSYMIRQVKTWEAGTIQLGDLNLLRFDEKGRFPTRVEWACLEDRSNELYRHLTEADRRRFLYGQIPYFVIKTAVVLGVVALGTLVAVFTAAVFTRALGELAMSPVTPEMVKLDKASMVPLIVRETAMAWVFFVEQCYKVIFFGSFLAWVAALGGIGSLAFIGMNALAVQEDATFDITNKKLIGLRVVLGALFAVVLTLPFGYHSFSAFIGHLHTAEPISGVALTSVLLLLPFVLGFSTTLVIMILNQLVEGVRTFFGKMSSPPPAAFPPPAVPASAEGTQARPRATARAVASSAG